jgi:16S rRNA (cytidine1402-2'-O)-methyltransferase
VLKSVAIILAEDTRYARRLLTHYGVATRLASYHEHNEARTAGRFVEKLLAGESLALITDAGTPLLSDPGERLVRAAIDAGVTVSPVPGASALLAALVASGLPSSPFTFYGFIPRKGRERRDVMQKLGQSSHTSVVYEAANRLQQTLVELSKVCGGDRLCSVARELTKLFEEVRRGTLDELARYYEEHEPRGETVVIVNGADKEAGSHASHGSLVDRLRGEGLSTKDIVGILVREHGVPRNVAYKLARGE